MPELIRTEAGNAAFSSVLAFLRLLQEAAKNRARLSRDRLSAARLVARFPTCRIDPRVLIRWQSPRQVQLGIGVSIEAYTVIALHPHSGSDVSTSALLRIGSGTWIGESNNLRADGGISIGSNCLVAQGVSIISTNHGTALESPIIAQPSRPDRTGVVIEDDVWIGANAVILPGVTIGKGAVVAAGSVVTRSVAPCIVVAGNPAKFLKTRA